MLEGFPMKLLVVGATGSVGTHLVSQALDHGHTVHALTRNPDQLTPHGRLTIVEGDPTNPATLPKNVTDVDAVFISLGGGLTGSPRSQGTQTIIDAMAKTGTKRLICQTTLGVGDSRDNLNFKWKYIMFGGLLRFPYNDHVKQEDYVRASDTNWTIVRPSAFTDGPVTGSYSQNFGPDATGLDLEISRADVAHFMLAQLEADTNIGKACSISN